MKPITLWSIITEDGKIKFNHIEDKWIMDSVYPKPKSDKFTNQKAWEKLNWKREYAWITDDYKVVKASDENRHVELITDIQGKELI